MIVVDTNVIAYLWIPGVGREGAERLYPFASSKPPRSSCEGGSSRFVTLARELGVPLYTSDRQILRDFPDVAVPLARA